MRETRLLEEIVAGTGCVVSTGGGMILAEENRRLMRLSGISIYLKVGPAALWRRLQYDKTRPLLNTDNPEQRLEQLFARRDGLYRSHADVIIKVSGRSPAKIAHYIKETLTRRTFGRWRMP